MKKKFATTVLLATMLLTVPTAHAAGIPTFDGATGIILTNNALEQAQQAMDALKQAKEGIEEARAQYEAYKGMISGNSNYGDFLDSPELNKIFPMTAWGDLYSDAKRLPELRERYQLYSNDSRVQRDFDKMLASVGALEDNYDASTERVRNAEQLRRQLNVVQTPQQKQDLQLRYQQELLELQNQQMRMRNMQMLVEQKEKLASKQRAQVFQDYIRGKSDTLPEYK